MIQLNIDKILEERGKTRYWLHRQSGISYQTIWLMAAHRTKAIHLETIEILCQVLDCTPNDLFTIDFDRPENE